MSTNGAMLATNETVYDNNIIENRTNSNIILNNDEEFHYENKRKWTEQEDAFLINFVNHSGSRNWKKITNYLSNKTPQQCAYRYDKLVKNMNKLKWSRNDDILLMELIDTYGQNWANIVHYMPGRSVHEVQERFTKKLDPNLKRCKFDKEEDELIIKFYEKYGNKWNEIAKYFKHRNASMIKNRYYSFIKKKLGRDNGASFTKSISENSSVYSLPVASTSGYRDVYNHNDFRHDSNSIMGQQDTYTVMNQFKNVKLNTQNLGNEKTVCEIVDNISVTNDMPTLGDQNLFNFGDNLINNYDYERIEKTLCKFFLIIDDFNNPEYILNKAQDDAMDIEEDYNFLPIIPKQGSGSPKLKPLENEDLFKEHCKNIFVTQKNNFLSEDPESYNMIQSQSSTNNLEENEKLMKQFNLLENVFDKVYALSNAYTPNFDISKAIILK